MVHGTLGLAYAPGLRLAVLRKKLEGARIPACTMHRNVGVYMRAKLNYLVIEKKNYVYLYISVNIFIIFNNNVDLCSISVRISSDITSPCSSRLIKRRE